VNRSFPPHGEQEAEQVLPIEQHRRRVLLPLAKKKSKASRSCSDKKRESSSSRRKEVKNRREIMDPRKFSEEKVEHLVQPSRK
jgi:hypothetical protein